MEVAFTAKMEDELDKVEDGQMKGLELLRPFHETFAKELEQANERIKSVKKVVEETSLECEKCGSKFLIRKSFQGEFLACSGFPKCRNTKSFTRNADGSLQIVVPEQTDQVCDKCQSPMVIKKGRYGPFLACSGYPKCTNTRPLKEETYPCPMDGCEGKVVSRRSKAGKRFFGCDAYPSCRFVLWNKPASVRCPECGFGLMQTVTVGGEERLRCPRKECSHECAVPEEAKAAE
jgi:DNA topoisomerase-1